MLEAGILLEDRLLLVEELKEQLLDIPVQQHKEEEWGLWEAVEKVL